MGDLLTPDERVEAHQRGLAPLPDPPIREDGSCFVCGQPRRYGGLKRVYASAALADPFCSAACARAWHGCSLPVPPNRRVTPEP